KTGRPKKATKEVLAAVVSHLSKSKDIRTLTLYELARALNLAVSPTAICRLLHDAGYRKVKPTKKPRLLEL
ncbi:hypothetical protein K431DRAFT_237031, partial [Polychaeton citri CBS 116435]